MASKILQLPNGLLIGGERVRDVEISKLSGVHEDMIRDKRNLRDGGVLDKLVKESLIRIGDITDPKRIGELYENSLLMADLTYLLVQIRSFGIGKKYEYDCACPH